MLKSVEITNFKAFNKTQKLKLKPITLIYGENSAGKSSFIQSILLMKQSVDKYGIDDKIALIPKGRFVDLGNYKEMVYKHDDTLNIKICNEIKVHNNDFKFNEWKEYIKSIKYETIFRCDELMKIMLNEINIYYNGEKKTFIKFGRKKENDDISNNFVIKYIDKEHYFLEAISDFIKNNSVSVDYSFVRKGIFKTLKTIKYTYKEKEMDIGSFCEKLIGVPVKTKGFLLEGNIRFNNNFDIKIKECDTEKDREKKLKLMEEREKLELGIQVFNQLLFETNEQYIKNLNSIVYLGPLRDYPERYYIFSGISPTDVGKSGKYTNDLLFTNKSLINKVNEWLHRFNINYDMHVDELKNESMSGIYFMRLVDKTNNVNVSPLDVGFGISQILPIIVQSIISENRIICIEQPEIHIHPRLQAELGTFFSECIKNNNQFIIETHSEHLMLRIQKLIREGTLSNDDVSVIYIDRGKNGSKCIELRLDEDGDFIDEWPNGFFEEGYREMF